MSGRVLVSLFIGFVALFGIALYYFQTYAFYEQTSDAEVLQVAGEPVSISGYQGIDASTSPLKLRGCFTAEPGAFDAAEPAPGEVPLTAPAWFECFDTAGLTEDLASGAALAYRIQTDEPKGFDLMVAVYPDGRGYLWRQLGSEFSD